MSCPRCGRASRAIIGTALVCYCALRPSIVDHAPAIVDRAPDVPAHSVFLPPPALHGNAAQGGSNSRFAFAEPATGTGEAHDASAAIEVFLREWATGRGRAA